MEIIYIRETEKTCDIIKKILLGARRLLNIIKVEDSVKSKMYYLPIFKDSKLSKYRIKRITNRINALLEIDGANTIALSQYLGSNQLFKNYLYSKNINILNGRFLFKCLSYKVVEYIFRIKNKSMEFRRSFVAN